MTEEQYKQLSAMIICQLLLELKLSKFELTNDMIKKLENTELNFKLTNNSVIVESSADCNSKYFGA